MGISRKQPQASHESQSTLKIKNMVCNRCIMVVDEVLRGRGLRVEDVQLGKAVVSIPGTRNTFVYRNMAMKCP